MTVNKHNRWRDAYRREVLPALVKFDPDLILISAGFDAHKKEIINFGYIGLLEEDYEWVTNQLVQVCVSFNGF
jgi:acetoin utilization deacetylase AcuC-like enzyme